MEIQQFQFLVGSRVAAVVASDIKERNKRLVENYAAGFFEDVAAGLHHQFQAADPRTDKKKRNHLSAALRLVYGQASEAFFAVLFAALQAPLCPIGWLQEYRRSDIVKLISLLDEGRADDLFRVTLKGHGWSGISNTINDIEDGQTFTRESVVRNFSVFWKKLGAEYSDEKQNAEYNQIKHGFRISPGGFNLSVGESPHSMEPLGGSAFGSEIHRLLPLKNSPDRKATSVFGLRRTLFNWDVDRLVARISLIASSLHNVLEFLKAIQRGSMGSAEFEFDGDPNSFDMAAIPILGVSSLDIDHEIEYQPTFEPDRESLLQDYKTNKIVSLNPQDIHRTDASR